LRRAHLPGRDVVSRLGHFLADLLINLCVVEAWVDYLDVAADDWLPAPLLHDNPPDGRHHSTQG
jgi:hypothetical protein